MKREQNDRKADASTNIIADDIPRIVITKHSSERCNETPKIMIQKGKLADLIRKKLEGTNYSNKHKKRKRLKTSFFDCLGVPLKRISCRVQKTKPTPKWTAIARV